MKLFFDVAAIQDNIIHYVILNLLDMTTIQDHNITFNTGVKSAFRLERRQKFQQRLIKCRRLLCHYDMTGFRNDDTASP